MSTPLADSNALPVDGEETKYRAVSAWAVMVLVLGILSPLAFVGPVLWVAPLLCIVAALIAMWKISSSAGELVGWNIALLGLLLAVLFGLAAPVHTLTRHYWLETRAEVIAKEFIDFLRQGRPQAAFQLTLLPRMRKPLDADLSAQIDKDAKARQKYDDFLRVEPAPTLLAQRDQAQVERLGSHILSSDETNDRIAVRYRISRQTIGAAPMVDPIAGGDIRRPKDAPRAVADRVGGYGRIVPSFSGSWRRRR